MNKLENITNHNSSIAKHLSDTKEWDLPTNLSILSDTKERFQRLELGWQQASAFCHKVKHSARVRREFQKPHCCLNFTQAGVYVNGQRVLCDTTKDCLDRSWDGMVRHYFWNSKVSLSERKHATSVTSRKNFLVNQRRADDHVKLNLRYVQ